MRAFILQLSLLLLPIFLHAQVPSNTDPPAQSRDSIISEHLKHGAWKHSYYSREWQEEIDKGIAKDSTIAYLWQQKAMPLFKQGKYELGMQYIDKAVRYAPEDYLDYRAFIKCIFAKSYAAAIADFEACKRRFGYSYVQDHSYDFYIALSKIQLNQYEEAKQMLIQDLAAQEARAGKDFVHFLDIFYLGICHYELGEYARAEKVLGAAIEIYPQFSDAQYYRSLCLLRMGDKEVAQALYKEAKENGLAGYTINESNAIYERYPYQVRWHNKR